MNIVDLLRAIRWNPARAVVRRSSHLGGRWLVYGGLGLGLAIGVKLRAAAPPPPVVSSVRQILTMSGADAFTGQPVHLEGMVIFADSVRGEILFKDSTGVITVKVDLKTNSLAGGKRATLDGKTSATLTRYPDHPSGHHYLTSFEAPTNIGNRYFARLRGFVYPPRSGEYTFWIASDNDSELWLSADEKPEKAKKIALLPDLFDYTAVREWDKFPTQRSPKIFLEAGRKYYIEALHWQEEGEDSLSVAWMGPELPRAVVAGEFLSPGAVAGADAEPAKRGSILREYWLGYPFPDVGNSATLRNVSATIERMMKDAPSFYAGPTVVDARITVSPNQPPMVPRSLAVGQPWSQEEDFQWVETEGVITQVTSDRARGTVVELREKEQDLRLRLANPQQAALEDLLNARVRVQGFCEGGFTDAGERVAAVLWVPSPADISLQPPKDEDWARLPVFSLEDLNSPKNELRAGQRVRLAGRVLESQPDRPLVVRDGVSRITGLDSPNGRDWTPITDSIAIPMNHSVYIGLTAEAAGDNLSTAVFDQVSMPLSASTGVEIGRPPVPGSSRSEDEKTIVMGSGNIGRAGGGDPTKDDLHYLFWRLDGDGEIVARLLSLATPETTPYPGASAGIMLRDTLAPDAKCAYVFMTTLAGTQFSVRREKGNPLEGFASDKHMPYWLKLVRQSAPPITVHSTQTLLLPQDQAIEMMGLLERTNRSWSLQQAFYRPVRDDAKLTRAANERRTEITTVQQIRQLNAEALGQVRPAKIRGVVTAKTTELYVQDNTGGVRIPAAAWQKFALCEVGQYVEVIGRCAPGLYSPVLEPSQSNDVVFLGTGRMPAAKTRTWNELMEGRDDAQWVEVKGVVRSLQGRALTLQIAGGSQLMDLAFDFPEDRARGLVDATVRIAGVCRVIANEKKQLIGTRLIVPSAEFVRVDEPAPADPFGVAAQPLGQLLQFSEQNEFPHRVKLAGVVTSTHEGSFFVEDATGAVEVEAAGGLALQQGDRVEVLGFPDARGLAVHLTDALARKTGTAALPKPMKIAGAGLPQAIHSARLIEIAAVFLGRSTLLGNEVLQFQKGERVFQGLLPKDRGSVPDLEAGSLVALTGVCRIVEDRAGNSSASNLEFEVLLSSPADVVVLAKPPWWNLRRLLWVGGIFVVGLGVAAIWIATILRKNRLLKFAQAELQKANEELETRVTHRTADLAKANAELSYEQALLRTLLDSSPDQIYFKDAESRFLKASQAQVVNFGVQSVDELIGKTDFDFFDEEHARPAFTDEQEIIRTGRPIIGKIEREVRKTGEKHWMLTSKMPLRNQAGEIVGTFGISKNITRIIEAEARLAELNKQLVDRSRQAGMAEVATGILHNVGNVLNSVNVSATLLLNRVRQSKIEKVPRLSALLKEHAADLGSFLTQDSRGQIVPGYLQALADELVAEQKVTVNELNQLRENIEHINEIVAQQQNYAKVSGVTEKVAVTELVEEALRMDGESLIRHGVEVVREYENHPVVTTERHKVLQVLINLIQNAKYACDAGRATGRQMNLRVTEHADRVWIAVRDNGVGISAENLDRIFAYGFTTRKEGKGFGLHHGALAAKELGGALRAESEGPGKGATFVLELPLLPKAI